MGPRKLVPLVVALAIACAPVALGACQATCAQEAATVAVSHAAGHAAGHAADHAAGHEGEHAKPAHQHTTSGHSCHEAAQPLPKSNGTAVNGVPHACGHGNELPASSDSMAKVILLAPAITPAAVEIAPTPARALWFDTAALRPPESPLALRTQLRV